MAGKDSFILTPDVVRGLNAAGACEGTPKGKRAQAAVQEAFQRLGRTKRPPAVAYQRRAGDRERVLTPGRRARIDAG